MSQAYRAYVGPAEKYDLVASSQFSLLTSLGLRESHKLLDIGCGSLRGGRLFIPYLAVGNYYGIEPNTWLVEEGIRQNVGQDLIRIKEPHFSDVDDFKLTTFMTSFDYLLAQSIFSHAARWQIERCLSEARLVMHERSIFAATFYIGEESYASETWAYPDNVSYRLEDMQAMIAAAGLRSRVLSWTHANGQTWLAITRDDATIEVGDPGDAANVGLLRAQLQAEQAWRNKIRSHPLIRLALTLKALKRKFHR